MISIIKLRCLFLKGNVSTYNSNYLSNIENAKVLIERKIDNYFAMFDNKDTKYEDNNVKGDTSFEKKKSNSNLNASAIFIKK